MTCLTAAQNYIAHGFSVVPLKLDGTKSPSKPWKEYQSRLASPQELKVWFGTDECGIGVVAGEISGNLHVIDFDHDAETYFRQFWRDIQDQLPGITGRLITVITPRPGRQIWFRQTSEPPASQVLAFSAPRSTGELDDDDQPIIQPQILIETRGTGGYACAVGTPVATHKAGIPYQLVHGSFESLPSVTDDEAETMLAICRSYSEFAPQSVQQKVSEPYRGEPRPGDIFNQHVDIRQLLIEAGWQGLHEDDGSVEYLTRPGKQVSDGYSASLGHIRSYDGNPLLYVFSANAAPFEQHKCYDAFGAYALLRHGGNFAAAAAAAKIQYAEQLKEKKESFRVRVEKQLPAAEPYTPFPTNLLPDVVQQYVLEHAAAISIDPAYVAVPMLSVLAGLIGQSRGLSLKSTWTEPSVIWTVTIGDVSSGKTPGWQAAVAPAERIETALHRAMKQQDTNYRQCMETYEQASPEAKRAMAKPTKEKFTQQFTINDATMETLTDIHDNNPKLLLACDELAAWLRSMDMYRGGKGRDVENWLAIYNGGPMQVNRKADNYRVYLPRTSISVCGTIQPGVAAESLYTERFIENGFVARLLSVQPPRSIVRWSDREVPESVNSAMFALAERLYALPLEPHEAGPRTLMLPCSKTAQQAFIKFTDDTADHAEKMDTVLRSSWLKLRPVAGRFALIFSVIRQLLLHPIGQATQAVDAESMRAGIELAWWFGRELERNYATSDYGDLREHLVWITRKHPNGVDARTFQAGRRGINTADDARIVMQKLMELNCGSIEGNLFIPHAAAT